MSTSEEQLEIREACADEGQWLYWTKDDGYGAAMQEVKRKI